MLKRSGRSGMALFKEALTEVRREQRRKMTENDEKNARKEAKMTPVPKGAPPIKRSTGTLTRLEILCPQCEETTPHRIVRYDEDYGVVRCATCRKEHRIPFKVRVST